MNKIIYAVLALLLLSSFACGSSSFDVKKESSSINISDVVPADFYQKYNVIFVCFDGLQSKHLSKYGYEVNISPKLDSFLSESTVFADARSVASWTVPSCMSLFTSTYPSEHRVTNKFVEYDSKTAKGIGANLKTLNPSLTTFAAKMRDMGYVTAAFTADAGVSSSFGFDIGFDTWFQTSKAFGSFGETIPKATEWLENNSDKKFFLFVHGYDVHGQGSPAEGFDYRYVIQPYKGQYTGSPLEQSGIREKGLAGALSLSDEDVTFWKAIYDEKISRADEKFGNFLSTLKQKGLMDNTIIVVFSDHGTEFYEHNGFDHGHTLYGELIDVLLSVYIPGKEGKVIRGGVSTLDVFPTIVSMTGGDIPSQVRGMDLSNVILNNSSTPKRNMYSETDYRLYTHKRSVESPEGWKLIMTMRDDGVKRELYNLIMDPTEQNNMLKYYPKIAYSLEQDLYQWMKGMNAVDGPWTYGCLPVYGDQCIGYGNYF